MKLFGLISELNVLLFIFILFFYSFNILSLTLHNRFPVQFVNIDLGPFHIIIYTRYLRPPRLVICFAETSLYCYTQERANTVDMILIFIIFHPIC